MFHSFLSDDTKQDDPTRSANSKHIIGLLNNWKIISSNLITIWGNKYGWSEHYICVMVLYLLKMLPQDYNIIIDSGVSASGHVREIVDDINITEKRFILQLMTTVKLPIYQVYETQIAMISATHKDDVILAWESKKNLSNVSSKMK